MDREKEIWKMVEIAREYSKDIANTPYYLGVVTDMTALYEANYRRADEVRKETAKKILQWLYNLCKGGFSLNASEVRRIAKDHGVEVDE